MRLVTTSESRLELSKALQFMTKALDILDQLGVPGEIGSTLDLAAARLTKFFADDPAGDGVQKLGLGWSASSTLPWPRASASPAPGRFSSVPYQHRRRYPQSC